MPPSKTLPQVIFLFLLLSRRHTKITHSSRTAFSEDIFSRAERGEEDYIVEKITKIKKGIGHKFYILVYVLLCNNLAASMLKCEGSLTELKKFSLKIRMCMNNYMK